MKSLYIFFAFSYNFFSYFCDIFFLFEFLKYFKFILSISLRLIFSNKLFIYLVSVNSDFRHHTTSFDGFIFAHRADCDEIIHRKEVFGRREIAEKTPSEKLVYLSELR